MGWAAYARDSSFVAAWLEALRDTSMVHINPFGARYVAESKQTLAFVQEPAFATHFTPDERDLVSTLLPYARKLTSDAPAPALDDSAHGESLIEHVLQNQRDWVVKEPYDIRGDGVTIGFDASRSLWRAAVERGVRGGHIVQRRVVPTSYPVVSAGSDRVEVMNISLDTYLFGGKVAGFGSKASSNAKVNVFQGGQKLAVHVVSREDS